MIYTLTLNLGSADFSLASEDLGTLMEEYTHLGGDSNLLKVRIKEGVPHFERGTVNSIDNSPATTETADADWDEDGPWNASGGSETTSKPQKTDPWDDTPIQDSKPSGRRSAPSRDNSGSSSSSSAVVEQDKFGRQWTLNLPDAPMCQCNPPKPAARMKAKAGPNAKNPGKPYTKWKCAEGSPSGDWRNKCELDEFPN